MGPQEDWRLRNGGGDSGIPEASGTSEAWRLPANSLDKLSPWRILLIELRSCPACSEAGSEVCLLSVWLPRRFGNMFDVAMG